MHSNNRLFQRHIVVTTLLVAYALFMTFYFGIDLLKSGQHLRFYLTVAGEFVVIVLTFFALRRRDRLRRERENDNPPKYPTK